MLRNLYAATFLLLFGAGSSVTAQTVPYVVDSVSMGGAPGLSYPMDVFYSLKNGVQRTDSNRNWHLGFQLTPFPATNVSIQANHVGGGVKVFSLHRQASVFFDSLYAVDTAGLTGDALQLYNEPTDWNYGAFNRFGGSTMFDFGWGTYDPVSHDVTGDSLYLIKIGSSVWKFWPKTYNSAPTDSISYTFRIARFDGSDDRTVTIRRADAGNLHFVHYDVLNNALRVREPAINTWDMVFTRYVDSAFFPGGGALYPVTGILSNPNVEVAEVETLTPDTAGYTGLPYNALANEIGYDWKITVGTGPSTTFALDTVSYFVKTRNTMEYYLLQFTRFDGSATGKTVLQRALLGTIAATTAIGSTPAAEVGHFALVPNPATNAAQIMLDVPAATSARVLLSDLSGRTLYSASAQLSAGVNGYALPTASLPAGTYVVTVSNGAWTASGKLQIRR